MNEQHDNDERFIQIGNWDWQPQKLKKQFGQLLYKDLKFEIGEENDLLSRIGNRLNKTIPEVINILKKLKSN